MFFRHSCGHIRKTKFHVDDNKSPVVLISEPCPYCLRTKYRSITYGKTTVFFKLIITTERGNVRDP